MNSFSLVLKSSALNLKGSIPLLTSSLYRFEWTFGGSVTSRKGGHLRHGRRISLQATAAGRRKGTKSRRKARVTPGAPVKSARGKTSEIYDTDSRYYIPTRRPPPKGQRPHSHATLKGDKKMPGNGNTFKLSLTFTDFLFVLLVCCLFCLIKILTGKG